jgi:hypothetical protein
MKRGGHPTALRSVPIMLLGCARSPYFLIADESTEEEGHES